jgi:hypothetical protein
VHESHSTGVKKYPVMRRLVSNDCCGPVGLISGATRANGCFCGSLDPARCTFLLFEKMKRESTLATESAYATDLQSLHMNLRTETPIDAQELHRCVQSKHRQHDRPDVLAIDCTEQIAVYQPADARQGPKNDYIPESRSLAISRNSA